MSIQSLVVIFICCVAVCIARTEQILVPARPFAEACLPRVALIEAVDLGRGSPDVHPFGERLGKTSAQSTSNRMLVQTRYFTLPPIGDCSTLSHSVIS